jgi:DNA-binding transcriptional MerR regulator
MRIGYRTMSKALTISRVARSCGLSRSTLLYYDRIGLLPPSGRTASGYRCYTARDQARLRRICALRAAGLTLAEVRVMLSAGKSHRARVVERRLEQLGNDLAGVRNQQRLLTAMLRHLHRGAAPSAVDKQMWVEMFRAAGLDQQAMTRWHAEFETRAPAAHQEFLVSLGVSEEECRAIRNWSQQAAAGLGLAGQPAA